MSGEGSFERAGDLLPDVGAAMAEASEEPPPDWMPRPEPGICPHCGRDLVPEWVPFPPALMRKYERPGEWWIPPCTYECEEKRDLKEWSLDVRRKRAEQLLEKSEIPERLSRARLSGFEVGFSPAARRGLEAVEAYLERWEARREAGKGLYLCGGVGTGKTHLASAVALELIERKGVPVLFHTAPTLLDRLRPSAGPDDRASWMNAATGAELLVLDDLGAEVPSEWARERVFVLVNERTRRALPTIYTSNVGPGELAERLGERTASRIIETSDFVLMDGPDYRVEGRKAGAR